MLPNKMKISEAATNSLRRFQGNTGLTANIGARLAFFTSLERGFRYDPEIHIVEHTGRELDKHTWLGERFKLVEMLLLQFYPGMDKGSYYKAWVAHVIDGAAQLEQKKSLTSLYNL